jgi:hypothetical protein
MRYDHKTTCDWCTERIGPQQHKEPHPFKGTGFVFCSEACVEKTKAFLIREKHDAARSKC